MFFNEVIIFSFIYNYLKLGRKPIFYIINLVSFPHNNRVNLKPLYTIYGDTYIIIYGEDNSVLDFVFL